MILFFKIRFGRGGNTFFGANLGRRECSFFEPKDNSFPGWSPVNFGHALMTFGAAILAKIEISSPFWAKIKVHRLFKGPNHTEIHREIIWCVHSTNEYINII